MAPSLSQGGQEGKRRKHAPDGWCLKGLSWFASRTPKFLSAAASPSAASRRGRRKRDRGSSSGCGASSPSRARRRGLRVGEARFFRPRRPLVAAVEEVEWLRDEAALRWEASTLRPRRSRHDSRRRRHRPSVAFGSGPSQLSSGSECHRAPSLPEATGPIPVWRAMPPGILRACGQRAGWWLRARPSRGHARATTWRPR